MVIREQIELSQPYSKVRTFTLTLNSNDSTDVLDISNYMRECNRISILVDEEDIYIQFMEKGDEITTVERPSGSPLQTDALRLIEGSAYFDDNISLQGRIVVRTADDDRFPTIRGIIWGR